MKRHGYEPGGGCSRGKLGMTDEHGAEAQQAKRTQHEADDDAEPAGDAPFSPAQQGQRECHHRGQAVERDDDSTTALTAP